jgi:plasmid stabilization system protein ParE
MKSVVKPLHFHPQVVADLETAIKWYERVSPKAADDFRMAAKAGLRAIGRSPKHHAIIFAERELRTCHLKPFSYVIVYRELAEVIRILGVRHTASNMASWVERD